MNDSISRQAAIDAASYECGELRGVFGRIEERLKALPSAQLEIIWCKDCRYYDEHECKHPRALIFSEDDDFCSHAERRTDG